ncbi:MAG: hypothetical protein JEZ11_26760 [Desulfobacterales bacterium]|nr:hypothetical protein [Desulfobacterales bacterium]
MSKRCWTRRKNATRMADRILQHAPRAGGNAKAEGSILGGIGDLIGGNNR